MESSLAIQRKVLELLINNEEVDTDLVLDYLLAEKERFKSKYPNIQSPPVPKTVKELFTPDGVTIPILWVDDDKQVTWREFDRQDASKILDYLEGTLHTKFEYNWFEPDNDDPDNDQWHNEEFIPTVNRRSTKSVTVFPKIEP